MSRGEWTRRPHAVLPSPIYDVAGSRFRGHRVVLTCIGVYGVLAYAVATRRHEFGVRRALGADTSRVIREVRRMFVRRTLALVGIGVAIGLNAAAGLTRLMASQLFGVSRLDPLTHVSVVVLLVATAGLAGYLSALRASLRSIRLKC